MRTFLRPGIRVAIIDADSAQRSRWVQGLTSECGVFCVGSHGRLDDAIRDLPAAEPAVVIVDVSMPGFVLVEHLAVLRASFPSARLLAVTNEMAGEALIEAFRGGIAGHLFKPCDQDLLVRSVHEVHEGGAPMSSWVAKRVLNVLLGTSRPDSAALSGCQDFNLSQREVEVLCALSEGLPFKLIADRLGVRPSTIRTHAERIYFKLSVRSRTEASAIYMRLKHRPAH